MLLLVGVPAAATELPAAGAFGGRAELQAAVDAWVADPAAAEATHGSISGWDTSRVDDLSGICESSCYGLFPSSFNDDVSAWDISRVTSMVNTFYRAEAFNSELVWDTSKVTDMRGHGSA